MYLTPPPRFNPQAEQSNANSTVFASAKTWTHASWGKNAAQQPLQALLYPHLVDTSNSYKTQKQSSLNKAIKGLNYTFLLDRVSDRYLLYILTYCPLCV